MMDCLDFLRDQLEINLKLNSTNSGFALDLANLRMIGHSWLPVEPEPAMIDYMILKKMGLVRVSW